MRIRIKNRQHEFAAELDESETARRIAAALPIRAIANRWGHEIYFEIPVRADRARDARADVSVGELGYWPDGAAFCIFFGPTPASTGEAPRAASPVNVIGRLTGSVDTQALNSVTDGTEIALEAAE